MNDKDELYRVASEAGARSRELAALQRVAARQRADAVRALLREHGETYTQVASRLGTTRSNVQSILRTRDTQQ